MKIRTAALAATAALTVPALAACGSDGSADDGTIDVVAGAYPFAWVTEQIGGTMVDVDNLTQPGVEPHDLELTPKQVGAVNDADLVVFLHGFQPPVDDALDQSALSDEARLDVADVVDLLTMDSDGHEHEAEVGEHGEEEHGEEEHGEEEHGADDGHDHGSLDPHVWLDPARTAQIAEAVRDRLSEIDPDNAAAYDTNATKLLDRLTRLDTDFSDGLASCTLRTFVTSHAAFGYLADAYDLEQVPIAGIEPNTEPSPQDLVDIADTVEAEGVTTIFTESLTSPKIAETVASETGATTAVLDPIEGLTDDTADEDYLSLMRSNLTALQKANDCS
ncbi:zinc transport system substrate-binding protein [Mumia flava]|uniref:Zinc transport system substrate-binding protein n=1 Tax=Mumia flava TaxID=1348852 RepID=A0A0B2BU09_9ACTN|nr:metal ABC transporter substrate-binding protein [Mumia flava]PJJ54061.1 zinc transport system substrate-binding protein [Mumia flava]